MCHFKLEKKKENFGQYREFQIGGAESADPETLPLVSLSNILEVLVIERRTVKSPRETQRGRVGGELLSSFTTEQKEHCLC